MPPITKYLESGLNVFSVLGLSSMVMTVSNGDTFVKKKITYFFGPSRNFYGGDAVRNAPVNVPVMLPFKRSHGHSFTLIPCAHVLCQHPRQRLGQLFSKRKNPGCLNRRGRESSGREVKRVETREPDRRLLSRGYGMESLKYGIRSIVNLGPPALADVFVRTSFPPGLPRAPASPDILGTIPLGRNFQEPP